MRCPRVCGCRVFGDRTSDLCRKTAAGPLIRYCSPSTPRVGVPFFEQRAEIVGQFALEIDSLVRHGVYEAQRLRMQGMAGHYCEAVFDELLVFREGRSLEDAVAAVAFVVEERMALPRHMDADLVRAARFEPALDQRHVAVTLQHPPVGHGVLAVRAVLEDEHLLPVAGAAPYVARDGPFVLFEIAPYQRHVTPSDGVVEELFGKPRVRLFVFGDHEQP